MWERERERERELNNLVSCALILKGSVSQRLSSQSSCSSSAVSWLVPDVSCWAQGAEPGLRVGRKQHEIRIINTNTFNLPPPAHATEKWLPLDPISPNQPIKCTAVKSIIGRVGLQQIIFSPGDEQKDTENMKLDGLNRFNHRGSMVTVVPLTAPDPTRLMGNEVCVAKMSTVTNNYLRPLYLVLIYLA